MKTADLLSSPFRCVPLPILLAEGNTPPVEIQVLKCGTFHSPQYGTFDITPAILASMAKNFTDKVRGIDLALDFAHESDKEAAAWFEELYLKEDGQQLWAKVRWTDKGATVVLGKQYRYISADFTFEYQDNETLKKYGPTLLGAGLTNRPVLKGMAPVELSEGEGASKMDEKDKKIQELEAKCAELEKAAAGKKAPAADDEKDVEMAAMKKKLAEYEAADKAAKELAQKAEADKKLAEKKGRFDVMLAEGKAVEAQREAFMSGDVEAFAKNAKSLNLSEQGSGAEGVAPTFAEEKAGTKLLKLAEDKVREKKLSLSEAILEVRKEQPELYKAYQTEVRI